jgi:hypothetical protein
MPHRDDRFTCQYAAPFTIHGKVRGGTILNVSNEGMLAYIGPNLRHGQRVVFTLLDREHRARIVRFDNSGYVGLRLDIPLSPAELEEITGALPVLQRQRKAENAPATLPVKKA